LYSRIQEAKQKDNEFKASLGSIMRYYLKKEKKE
jgi:hypothetical protein